MTRVVLNTRVHSRGLKLMTSNLTSAFVYDHTTCFIANCNGRTIVVVVLVAMFSRGEPIYANKSNMFLIDQRAYNEYMEHKESQMKILPTTNFRSHQALRF